MSQLSDLPPGFNSTPRLFLPLGMNYSGVLLFAMRGAAGEVRKLTVWLDAAHVQLLTVLNQVMAQDASLPWPARGWRHPKTLAQLVGKQTGYPPQAETIRTYLTRIQAKIRDTVVAEGDDSMTVPQLFERRRKKGARLSVPWLEIIDGTQQEDA